MRRTVMGMPNAGWGEGMLQPEPKIQSAVSKSVYRNDKVRHLTQRRIDMAGDSVDVGDHSVQARHVRVPSMHCVKYSHLIVRQGGKVRQYTIALHARRRIEDGREVAQDDLEHDSHVACLKWVEQVFEDLLEGSAAVKADCEVTLLARGHWSVTTRRVTFYSRPHRESCHLVQ